MAQATTTKLRPVPDRAPVRQRPDIHHDAPPRVACGFGPRRADAPAEAIVTSGTDLDAGAWGRARVVTGARYCTWRHDANWWLNILQ